VTTSGAASRRALVDEQGDLDGVLHPELGEAIAGVQDERDDGRAHAVEDRAHRRQPAEMHVEGGQRRHDDDVRQDERPPSGPGAPESAADVGEPDADLDGQRAGQGLADGDALPHLVARHPLPIGDELALHLPHERDGPAEAEEAQAQEVEDELANRDARRCVVGVHGFPPGWWAM